MTKLSFSASSNLGSKIMRDCKSDGGRKCARYFTLIKYCKQYFWSIYKIQELYHQHQLIIKQVMHQLPPPPRKLAPWANILLALKRYVFPRDWITAPRYFSLFKDSNCAFTHSSICCTWSQKASGWSFSWSIAVIFTCCLNWSHESAWLLKLVCSNFSSL